MHGLFGATGLGSLSSAHHAWSLPFLPASLPLLAYTERVGSAHLARPEQLARPCQALGRPAIDVGFGPPQVSGRKGCALA